MLRFRAVVMAALVCVFGVLCTSTCAAQDLLGPVSSTPPPSVSSGLNAQQQTWPPPLPSLPTPPVDKKPTVVPIPLAAKATWISYPAVGVNTKIDVYTSYDGILNPPGEPTDKGRIFALSPYDNQAGAGATNTYYLLGHSYDDGTSVTNQIMQNAKPGQLFTLTTNLGKVCYRVDHISKELKQAIADRTSEAAKKRPGWAVYITCYAAPGDPHTVWGLYEAVLYAQMTPCAA